MRSLTRAWSVAALVGILLVAGTVQADPFAKPTSAEARNHLTRGNRLYGVRSFEEALVEYKAGALIEPTPVFDYNLGQCFRQLGRYQEAIWYYERFLLDGNPEGEVLGAVKSFIVQMKSELDREAASRKPTEASPRPTAPTPIQQRIVPQHTDQAPEPSRTAWYHDKLGCALLGTGVIGLAIGGGFLADGAILDTNANSNPDQLEDRRSWNQAHTRTVAGAVVGAGGALLIAAGAIKLALHPREGSAASAWNVRVSNRDVSLFVRF